MSIERVAMIGAGTMGHALALVHALGGCRVMLHDAASEVLARAPALIAKASATLCEAGTISTHEAEAARNRVCRAHTIEEAIANADLIVEAVVEKAEVKRAVFEEIDRFAPASAIIASNTSYLDIFPLIPASRQENAAIAHWYSPPYIVDLVDIAPGPSTAPEVIATLRALYESFGKAPLVFDRLVPGYVANRLQAALNLECLRMIDEGWASAGDIDFSIRHGLVDRLALLGHMRKMDYTGLEMIRNGLAARTYQPPENTGHSPALARLIDAGRTGVRAGAGFYDYGDEPVEDLLHRRDLGLLQLKKMLSGTTGGQE
ncbi:3-hydroxyacyl-CoA dehydrogenase family protein [Martelella radicis]|uniref:3-hydroxybutyryl-CoA dehydrogenase n=1 Tax=Martelella radicis TaxID=1397476 RepID=A0A7W6PBD7_9HYPH|nr:3-hydroxyacyl-CoA dehydrogenase family protein [Martelella radicis]MBB4123775.1 3-hydroxybutyryl-CoA dehydrogenase [Martelella radicis]